MELNGGTYVDTSIFGDLGKGIVYVRQMRQSEIGRFAVSVDSPGRVVGAEDLLRFLGSGVGEGDGVGCWRWSHCLGHEDGRGMVSAEMVGTNLPNSNFDLACSGTDTAYSFGGNLHVLDRRTRPGPP